MVLGQARWRQRTGKLCHLCDVREPRWHLWCMVRLLNALPASRMSATALEAFLKTAGFRMNGAYGRQFHKLLAYVDTVFMADLARQGDPDARAVHLRLRTYMHDRQFIKEPDGRRMPFSALSATEHA